MGLYVVGFLNSYPKEKGRGNGGGGVRRRREVLNNSRYD